MFLFCGQSSDEEDAALWVEKGSESKKEDKPLVKGPRLEV